MNDKLALFTKWCGLAEAALGPSHKRHARRARWGTESVVVPAESFECGCQLRVSPGSRPDHLECECDPCEQHAEYDGFLHGLAVGIGIDTVG